MNKRTLLAGMIVGTMCVSSAVNAAEIIVGEQQLGDHTANNHQTNWGSSNAWADGVHTATVNVPAPAVMSFAQFDDLGGTRTLTQVIITIAGAWHGELTAQNQASATTNTTINSGELQVRFAYDVFNDYATFGDGNIESSGFVFDGAAHNAALDTTDPWNAPALPIVLTPGQTAADTDVSGGFGDSTTFGAGAELLTFGSGLGAFIGASTWDLGCFARSDDNFDTSGGSPLTGHEAYASCSANVKYVYDTTTTQVPAPASLLLMAAGLIGFGVSRKRG